VRPRYAKLVNDRGVVLERFRLHWWVRPVQPADDAPVNYQARKVFEERGGVIHDAGVVGPVRTMRERAEKDGEASGLPRFNCR
jgi:hypothetical protein